MKKIKCIHYLIACIISVLVFSCDEEDVATNKSNQINLITEKQRTEHGLNALKIDSLLMEYSTKEKTNARASSSFIAYLGYKRIAPNEVDIQLVASPVSHDPLTEFVQYTATIYENGVAISKSYIHGDVKTVVKSSGTYNYTGAVSYQVKSNQNYQTIRSGYANAGPISVSFEKPEIPGVGQIITTGSYAFYFGEHCAWDEHVGRGDRFAFALDVNEDLEDDSDVTYTWYTEEEDDVVFKVDQWSIYNPWTNVKASASISLPSTFYIYVRVSKPGYKDVIRKSSKTLTLKNCANPDD